MKECLTYLIKKYMNKHHELRFGQVIANAATMGGWKDKDLYYCPDGVILNGLVKMVEGDKKE